jgi:flagellar biosynthesis GTPase FlhF
VEINEILTLLTSILILFNGYQVAVAAWKKLKPEVKKLETEIDTENIETANLNLEGAKISALILLDRVNELKGEVISLRSELNSEREFRKQESISNEKRRKEELAAMEIDYTNKIEKLEKIRASDVSYFRRRIKDLEREARDYRSWAAKLNKQIVDAKLIPVPFVPTLNESDESITAVRPELETGPLDNYAKEKKE